MKLKNTSSNLTIKSKKAGKRILITSGVFITSLFILFSSKEKEQSIENSKSVTEESTIDSEFNKYSTIYLDILKNIDYKEFDPNFVNIYKNGVINYKDQEYSINELFLKQMDDGSNYITKAGENTDFLTGEKIEKDKKQSIKFKDSSCFLKMYEDGIFDNNNIEVNKDIFQQYIDEWDEKQHQAVPTLKAKQQASAIYQEKYGKER